MNVKAQITNLVPYKPGRSSEEVKKEFGLSEIVKLASNENPFGYSPKIDAWFKENGINHAIYPDGYAANLRYALAEKYSLNPEQFIIGNGSDEVIQIVSRALLEKGKNTIMPVPTFPQYKHNAIIEGAEAIEVPLVNGAHDLKKMAEMIDENTSLIWVCSPNNPTGTYISDQKLRHFLDLVPEHVLVVLDEAYYEYVEAVDYYDALSLLRTYPNLLVTRTFSKAYGLAGFRVGYGMASPELIASIEPVREPFNTNVLGQISAEIALSDPEFIEVCRKENKEGLKQYYAFCDELGLSYYPSSGNFILIDFKKDGDYLFEELMKKGFIVRSGQALGFPTSLRITIGSKAQNEKIIQALKTILTQ
ncbi:histidinol-phosphate transaminase [Jeotgalibacillus proteolyticus]|uniref:Histidinol-phosphate aminotransferase n=1 Tax=Jeotgalibacillus proteolyticus TaxID=2082395 RepID=A0A2S5GEC4_9BACL|nr:histidinol-phosphate transaminase [Jeotgalibacillus proteolyticus]PPA71261.1 histidinol-phosphate transaminase [Jeotgalibacillus proteolyticus]